MLPKKSYYYEGSSYYRYSVPAQYKDTSYSYHTTSAHLVDTSQYSFSVSAPYDNTTLDSVRHALEI